MKSATTSHLRRAMALAVAAAFTMTACGSSGDDATDAAGSPATASVVATPSQPAPSATASQSGSDATTDMASDDDGPITVTGTTGIEVSLDAPAEAIVSLSPTATESLFAIGAGDQVVAVDEFSYYPEQAPVTDLSGFQPNAEAVADHEPDLVVASGDANDLVAQLDALGIPTLIQGSAMTFDDVYTQIAMLGTVTGQVDGATVLVEQMQAEIDKLVADTPVPDEPATYYHEVSTDYYTTTSSSFVGQVYGLFGLVNIADEAGEELGTDFPQVSEETIIEASPDLIYLTSGAPPEEVAARPGWQDITAVVDGSITTLPPDVPSRWGPRVVEFAQVVAESLAPLATS